MMHQFNEQQKISLAFIGSKMKGVVHNINTPLSAIMGRSEMLQMRLQKIKSDVGTIIDVTALDKCLKDIGIILENSGRVTEILRQVMQKCINAEADGVRPINIADVLKEELEFLHADMDYKHSIEKTFKIDDDIPCLNGNYLDFSICFLEIIVNSINAMLQSTDRKLSIIMKSTDGYIRVEFHDTGCGIKDDNIKRVKSILDDPARATEHDMNSCGGIVRVAQILKKYKALSDIQSRPGDTTFCISFPF